MKLSESFSIICSLRSFNVSVWMKVVEWTLPYDSPKIAWSHRELYFRIREIWPKYSISSTLYVFTANMRCTKSFFPEKYLNQWRRHYSAINISLNKLQLTILRCPVYCSADSQIYSFVEERSELYDFTPRTIETETNKKQIALGNIRKFLTKKKLTNRNHATNWSQEKL